MTVGSIVNDTLFPNSFQYVQPAGTVTIMITGVFTGDTDSKFGITDGNPSPGIPSTVITAGPNIPQISNLRCGITNANYLALYSTTIPPAYTGIQLTT